MGKRKSVVSFRKSSTVGSGSFDDNNNITILKTPQNSIIKKKRKKVEESFDIPRKRIWIITKEILQEMEKDKITIGKEAMDIIHLLAEKHLVKYFKMANVASQFRGSNLIQPRDTHLCRKVLEENIRGDL
uniref:Histone H2A/H2B/H3 domain-containing protein n=1 Tax=Strongyloides stercoralis TaxID=6248 RepID=A0A0K0E004_STRER